MSVKPISIATEDGVRLALWPIPSKSLSAPCGRSIILTHGLFSNHRICLGLAQYLADHGFACWILEWRGHGASERQHHTITLDDVANYDVSAAIDTVLSLSHTSRVEWIGHSMGGLFIAMWLARQSREQAKKIGSLTLLASHAISSERPLHQRLVLRMLYHFLKFQGNAPGHWIRLGPEPERASLIRQWCRWNILRKFQMPDGEDYLAALSHLRIPVLAFSAEKDKFMGPQSGCKKLFSALSLDERKFHHCSIANGFMEDYTHSRIMLSSAAEKDIWPIIKKHLSLT